MGVYWDQELKWDHSSAFWVVQCSILQWQLAYTYSKGSSVTSIKIWWNILELSQILSFLDCCSVFELLHRLLLVIICQSDFLIFIPTLFRSSVLSSVSLCHVLLVGKMQCECSYLAHTAALENQLQGWLSHTFTLLSSHIGVLICMRKRKAYRQLTLGAVCWFGVCPDFVQSCANSAFSDTGFFCLFQQQLSESLTLSCLIS